jgi:hypothetical protein
MKTPLTGVETAAKKRKLKTPRKIMAEDPKQYGRKSERNPPDLNEAEG